MTPMNSIDEAVTYLLEVAGVTLVQLFTLGGPLLILLALLSWLSGYVRVMARVALGATLFHLLFGWIGSSVHETGHAVAAKMFGHQIAEFRPFVLNPNAQVKGYVIHGWHTSNIFQSIGNFFVGIAPVVFGPLVIFLSAYLLFWNEISLMLRRMTFDADRAGPVLGHVFSASLAFLGFLFSPAHLLDWRLYVFLYIAFAIGTSIRLSPPDIEGARGGCLIIVMLLFMFNLVLLPMGIASEATFTWLSPYYTYFYVVLVLVMLLNLLAALLLWLPASIRSSA
jgi:hypothetical protein